MIRTDWLQVLSYSTWVGVLFPYPGWSSWSSLSLSKGAAPDGGRIANEPPQMMQRRGIAFGPSANFANRPVAVGRTVWFLEHSRKHRYANPAYRYELLRDIRRRGRV